MLSLCPFWQQVLNNAPAYCDAGLVAVKAPLGVHHLMSTRNNNFSNRSQKSTVVVLAAAVRQILSLKSNEGNTLIIVGVVVSRIQSRLVTCKIQTNEYSQHTSRYINDMCVELQCWSPYISSQVHVTLVWWFDLGRRWCGCVMLGFLHL